MSEKFEVIKITPEWADRVLKEQEQFLAEGKYRQRKLSDRVVEAYVNTMKHGNWVLTNQGIAFDENGYLIDGRHRLWAVVKSGATVQMLVVTGLKPKQDDGFTISPQDAIDNGRVRTVANQLQIDGFKNAAAIASCARNIALILLHPKMSRLAIIETKQILSIYGGDIDKIFNVLGQEYRSPLVAAVSLYHSFKPRKAFELARDLKEMTNLGTGSPIIALHKYHMNKPAGGFNEQRRSLEAYCLAIMHYDQDSTINSLRQGVLGVEWMQKVLKPQVEQMAEIVSV